ncbi:hypothetical protein D3C86_1853500 [compost metagenome]
MKATVKLIEYPGETGRWTGAVVLQFEWETNKKGTTSSSGYAVRWHIRGYRRWLVIVAAFLQVVLLSRVGISILYPLVMFAAAMVTSLAMLWRAL